MAIQFSDEELVWLYIPIPISATQVEVEGFIRSNAFNLAMEFIKFREHKQKTEGAIAQPDGCSVH